MWLNLWPIISIYVILWFAHYRVTTNHHAMFDSHDYLRILVFTSLMSLVGTFIAWVFFKTILQIAQSDDHVLIKIVLTFGISLLIVCYQRVGFKRYD